MVSALAVPAVPKRNTNPRNFLTRTMNRILWSRAISRLQFFGRPRLSLWHFSARQLPRSLFLERQSDQLSDSQFMFITKRRDADRDLGLRNVAAQTAMNFVPPAKDRAPVRIGLAFDDGMMNAVHPRRDNDVVQDAFQA